MSKSHLNCISLLLFGSVDYSSVYYNVVPVYVCKNVKYGVDSAPFVVDLHELVELKRIWDDSNGGVVYFYRSYNVGGTLEQADDNDNAISAI